MGNYQLSCAGKIKIIHLAFLVVALIGNQSTTINLQVAGYSFNDIKSDAIFVNPNQDYESLGSFPHASDSLEQLLAASLYGINTNTNNNNIDNNLNNYQKSEQPLEAAKFQEEKDYFESMIEDYLKLSGAPEGHELSVYVTNDQLIHNKPINDPAELEALFKPDEDSVLRSNASKLVLAENMLPSYIRMIMKQAAQDDEETLKGSNVQHNQLIRNPLKAIRGSSVNRVDAGVKSKVDAIINEANKSDRRQSGSSEYIDHPLALIGQQYIQGGAGEGHQLLGPDGTFENVQVIKTDDAVPSYCNPPNPCPIGYSAKDGCLENFVNSASFSREYQAKQQCSCDNEHSLFNCASPVSTLKNDLLQPSLGSGNSQTTEPSVSNRLPGAGGDGDDDLEPDTFGAKTHSSQLFDNWQLNEPDESKLNTLARTINNRFGNLPSVRNLIAADYETRQED